MNLLNLRVAYSRRMSHLPNLPQLFCYCHCYSETPHTVKLGTLTSQQKFNQHMFVCLRQWNNLPSKLIMWCDWVFYSHLQKEKRTITFLYCFLSLHSLSDLPVKWTPTVSSFHWSFCSTSTLDFIWLRLILSFILFPLTARWLHSTAVQVRQQK